METNALDQSAHERDLAPLFGDLSQSDKLSEIKPPSINLLAMFDLPPSPQIKPSYAGKEQLL